jgi:hypothetical protein
MNQQGELLNLIPSDPRYINSQCPRIVGIAIQRAFNQFDFSRTRNEELFAVEGQLTFWGDGEGEAYMAAKNAERERRIRLKELKDQESATKVNETKNALPYSDQLAEEICDRISAGELLTVICLDEHLPTVRRCNQWLRDHGEFAALYQSALSDRLSIFEEQIIQIPDEAARDFDEVKSKGSVRRVLDPGKLTAAKLRVEVRRLHLKAGKPANTKGHSG